MKRIFNAVYKRLRPIEYARSIGVIVGDGCQLINVSFSTEPYLVAIGNHVSATATHFETHDGGVWVFRDEYPQLDIVKRITVGNNVYLGYGCVILPGVAIGDNVVVGAGAVVANDIPNNSVAVGVPARVIKTMEAYREKALSSGINTKHLSPQKKRRYLEAHLRAQ